MVEVKPENVAVGKRIKSIRISQGMDLAAFGEKVTPSASASVASRWERGVTKPNSQRLKSIAEIGKVSVDFLLNGSQRSESDSTAAATHENSNQATNNRETINDDAAALAQAEHADLINDIQQAVLTDRLIDLREPALGTIKSAITLAHNAQSSDNPELAGVIQAFTVLLGMAVNPAVSGNKELKEQALTGLKQQFKFVIDNLEK